jgi:dipeptidyl aminopeptidase/acylaminoacyl peptidase
MVDRDARKKDLERIRYDLRRYLSMKSAYSPEFSPDGAKVAYLTDLTGVPQVWQVTLEDDGCAGHSDQITLGDDRVGFISYASGSDRMIYGSDTGGDERFQLSLVEASGESLTRLTTEPKVIHNWGDWSPDEKRISFSSNARDQSYFDIYVQELGDLSTELVHRYDGNAYPVSWSPDGSKILFEVMNAPFDHDLFLLALGDRSVEHLTAHEGEAAFYSPSFAADGKGVYCITDLGKEFAGIARIDLSTRELEYVYAEDWDIETLAFTQDKKRAAFTVNDGGASRLMLWRLSEGEEGPRELDLPVGVVGGLDWSNDGGKLAFSLSSSVTNSDVWVYDLRPTLQDGRKRLSRLTRSSTCGVVESSFIEPELREIKSFDGVEIPSYLYLPAEADTRMPDQGGRSQQQKEPEKRPLHPLIVYLHGGPESQFRPGFTPLFQYFLRLGFAVLATNFRGSTGYGRRFTHLDDVRGRMDTVKDAELALRDVLARYPIDSSKVVAWGGSYGGFMVLASLYSTPALWAAGVDIVGISNFVTFLRNTGPWRRRLRIAEYGDPDGDKDFLEGISPNNNAHRITAPLFIIHGTNDPRVPVGEAEQIERTLKGLGRDARLLKFDDEGHGLVKLKNRISGYSQAVEFIIEHISG